MYRTRDVEECDRAAVMALADQLLVGVAPWRDEELCRTAARSWVMASINRNAQDRACIVVTDQAGKVIGFVSVEESTHFSGEREAYIGEPVVDNQREGAGVGRLLVEAAERWARGRGYSTLTLVTGTANTRARGFYDRLGFLEEEVRLTKLLE